MHELDSKVLLRRETRSDHFGALSAGPWVHRVPSRVGASKDDDQLLRFLKRETHQVKVRIVKRLKPPDDYTKLVHDTLRVEFQQDLSGPMRRGGGLPPDINVYLPRPLVHMRLFRDTMPKESTLVSYVKLLLETMHEHPQAPFKLTDPSPQSPKRGGYAADHTIYREFPLVMTPKMMTFMKVGPEELDGENILSGEHEIEIEVQSTYTPARRGYRGGHPDNWEPDDPSDFEVEFWEPLSLDGIWLTDADAKALKEYLGDLTDEEINSLGEHASENPPEPDYDDSPRDDLDDY